MTTTDLAAVDAVIEQVKTMPNGSVLTADAKGRRFTGPQRLMRTGGAFHFVNADGLGVNAYDIDLFSIRDVVAPPETNR